MSWGPPQWDMNTLRPGCALVLAEPARCGGPDLGAGAKALGQEVGKGQQACLELDAFSLKPVDAHAERALPQLDPGVKQMGSELVPQGRHTNTSHVSVR